MKRSVFSFQRFFAVVLILCIVLSFSGCQTPQSNTEATPDEIQNLEKLCKVWGYTKYNHPAFLFGTKDWDEELLNLIPTVSTAKKEQVNEILHKWFISLGEIDYNTPNQLPQWAGAKEEDKMIQANTEWISKEYLGEKLEEDLSKLGPIPNVNRSKAPVKFDQVGVPDFSNEKVHKNMKYTDSNYRLLGLFRIWNAIEYYFPYLDIMDESWNDLLTEYIPKILDGTDKKSFELTISELTAHLQDAHVSLSDLSTISENFGKYGVPVDLIQVDGKIVVQKVYGTNSPVQVGDIILKLNDTEVQDRVHHLMQYIAVSDDKKIAGKIFPFLLRSNDQKISITVLREGKEEILDVESVKDIFNMKSVASNPYELLEGNIGLINPSILKYGEINMIMSQLRDTNGLIVDLRQYPSSELMHSLAAYLKKTYAPFSIITVPSQSVPGTMIKMEQRSGMTLLNQEDYYYEKPVVLLMNEETWSQPEYTVMSLRTGENVTVLGSNSIGADGNVAILPLPNGNGLRFTSLGVYTPEMGQTQRIGLTPDIEVYPTIEGIKQGRDELMEAAIKYLKDNSLKNN